MIQQLINNTIGDTANAVTIAINNMKPEDVDKLLEAFFCKIIKNSKTKNEFTDTIIHLLFSSEEFKNKLIEWHEHSAKKGLITHKENQISDIDK